MATNSTGIYYSLSTCQKRRAASAVIVLCALLIAFLFSEVRAQSTVDDSASRESSTLDEAVNILREDLKDVKNILGSHQEHLMAACAVHRASSSNLLRRRSLAQNKLSSLPC